MLHLQGVPSRSTRDPRTPELHAGGLPALLDGLTEVTCGTRAGTLRGPSGRSYHLVLSLELLPREVAGPARARACTTSHRSCATAERLGNPSGSRGQTLESLRRRYDAAFAAALSTLDGVGEDEFQLGARFWSEGFRDIAGLYAGQVDRLSEHAADVRALYPASRGQQAVPSRGEPT